MASVGMAEIEAARARIGALMRRTPVEVVDLRIRPRTQLADERQRHVGQLAARVS